MFSHVMLGASDVARMVAFYDALLLPLGMIRNAHRDDDPAQGASWRDPSQRRPTFDVGPPYDGLAAVPGNGVMVAFLAPSRAAVDAFHATALTLGAMDEGAPGPRSYAADYYGAYARDPEGNKIHVVHRHATDAP